MFWLFRAVWRVLSWPFCRTQAATVVASEFQPPPEAVEPIHADEELNQLQAAVEAWQPPPETPETPEASLRRRQLEWHKLFTDICSNGKPHVLVLPLTMDSPGLPFPRESIDGSRAQLQLTATGLIDSSRMPAERLVHDPVYEAFVDKLWAEAQQTEEGQFVAAKHRLAEEYAAKVGVVLTDPPENLPPKLKPFRRYIPLHQPAAPKMPANV